jgi:hypothetical protein
VAYGADSIPPDRGAWLSGELPSRAVLDRGNKVLYCATFVAVGQRLMPTNLPLKVAIAASGRKQKDVARRARIDQWRLSRIVQRDIAPRPEERARLAKVLGCPEADLFHEAS